MLDRSEKALTTVAFYLPQFHPIPENDEWWGPGFTEWRNVTQAKPLFKGHYQPHIPRDLGFYDLRTPETREDQVALAKAYGIDAFCYYHYWFGGRRLLERPFQEVLSDEQLDHGFMLCWANENWTRRWDGGANEVLAQQAYSDEDDLAHIRWLCEAFADPRYVRVDGKPALAVYNAGGLPDPRRTADIWRTEAERLGIGALHLCRVESFWEERGDPAAAGFDAAIEFWPDCHNLGTPLGRGLLRRLIRRARRQFIPRALRQSSMWSHSSVYSYAEIVELALQKARPDYAWYRGVSPGWDNSARRKAGNAVIWHDSTPRRFQDWIEFAARDSLAAGSPLLFVNAWNEWAEGNHLEPCMRWGHAYLEAFRAGIDRARGVPR